ncbi:MAG: RNA-processing protein [Thermoprotei archaeon]|nr:MAG: RNA-processing protein [Thermoprotei archaeon]
MRGLLPISVGSKKLRIIESHKNILEKQFGIHIIVDKKNSIVYLKADKDTLPYKFLKAKQAIEAISLGFPAKSALKLSDDNIFFEVMDLTEVYRDKRDLKRIKARIIGSEGKVKVLIEEMTGTEIAVGEKEVGIIGDYEQVKTAREAIEMIIRGRSHRSVNNFLRIESRKLKKRRLELWEKTQSIFDERRS